MINCINIILNLILRLLRISDLEEWKPFYAKLD